MDRVQEVSQLSRNTHQMCCIQSHCGCHTELSHASALTIMQKERRYVLVSLQFAHKKMEKTNQSRHFAFPPFISYLLTLTHGVISLFSK